MNGTSSLRRPRASVAREKHMSARRARPVSRAQQLSSYAILTVLALMVVWLLVQQGRFNPAVVSHLPAHGDGKAGLGPADQAQGEALLPAVSGFTPTGPVQYFQADNLSDKINGKAELYLSAGFRSLAVQSFTLASPPGAYLEVFLYDMGEPQNAYAVFSSQRRPGAATLTFRPNAYATANALFFTSGRFYVEMILDRATDEVATVVQAFLSALLAKLPAEEGESTLAGLFPAAGLVSDSVRLNAADAFGLADFNNVYTAEYTVAGGRATAFLAQQPDAQQAAAMAQRVREFFQATGWQIVDKQTIPQDITLLGSEDGFVAIFVADRLVAGVYEAPSLAAALELAQRLQNALAGR